MSRVPAVSEKSMPITNVVINWTAAGSGEKGNAEEKERDDEKEDEESELLGNDDTQVNSTAPSS